MKVAKLLTAATEPPAYEYLLRMLFSCQSRSGHTCILDYVVMGGMGLVYKIQMSKKRREGV